MIEASEAPALVHLKNKVWMVWRGPGAGIGTVPPRGQVADHTRELHLVWKRKSKRSAWSTRTRPRLPLRPTLLPRRREAEEATADRQVEADGRQEDEF
jgi:hypothetical protein